IAERILRFHLVDNTRGEPPLWEHKQIQSAQMNLRVEKVTATGVQLRLDGKVVLATQAALSQADRGYDARLIGFFEYNAGQQRFQRIDIVALGDHWGEGTYTRGARPGHTPLGIAFELARGDSPADLVPPQGAREIAAYWGRSN